MRELIELLSHNNLFGCPDIAVAVWYTGENDNLAFLRRLSQYYTHQEQSVGVGISKGIVEHQWGSTVLGNDHRAARQFMKA